MADQRPPAPPAGFTLPSMLPLMTQGWNALPPQMQQHLLQSHLVLTQQQMQQMQQQAGMRPPATSVFPTIPLPFPVPAASAAAATIPSGATVTTSQLTSAVPAVGTASAPSTSAAKLTPPLGGTALVLAQPLDAADGLAAAGGGAVLPAAAAVMQATPPVATAMLPASEAALPFQSVVPVGPQLPQADASHEEVCADEGLFLNCLVKLHDVLGIDEKIPVINQRPLNLHLLYRTVTSKGGMEEVIQRKAWKEVSGAFNFPETITSSSYQLRKAYVALLWDFEQVYFHRRSGPRVSPPPGSYKTAALKAGAGTQSQGATAMPKTGGRGKKRKEAPIAAINGTPGQAFTSAVAAAAVAEGGTGMTDFTRVTPPHFQGLPASAPTALTACATGPGEPEAGITTGSKGEILVDSTFDCGYFVTVNLGEHEFRGMLYFPPPQHTRQPFPIAAQIDSHSRRKGYEDATLPRPCRTAFSFFSQEAREHVRAVHPGLLNKEVSKRLGELWTAASEAEKAPYLSLAAQDKLRYQAELEAYNYRLASAASTRQAQEAEAALVLSQSAISGQPMCVDGQVLGPHATNEPLQGQQDQTAEQPDAVTAAAAVEAAAEEPTQVHHEEQPTLRALAADLAFPLPSLPAGAIPLAGGGQEVAVAAAPESVGQLEQEAVTPAVEVAQQHEKQQQQ